MMQQYEQSSKIKLVASVIAIVVIAGVVLLVNHLKSTATTTAVTTPTSSYTSGTDSSAANSDSSASSNAATGTSTATGKAYSASSTYEVPHGSESITVNLTVANGTITNATIQNSEYDHDSARYQEDFAAAYKQYVVGKKIAGLQLGAVAGASDTAQGFNDAVSQIATQVK